MDEKKPKKVKEYKVEQWHKEPTGDEMREIVEITEAFEEDGLEVDHEVLREGIVLNNMPKYMTLIDKDMKIDSRSAREKDYFNLQKRQADVSNMSSVKNAGVGG